MNAYKYISSFKRFFDLYPYQRVKIHHVPKSNLFENFYLEKWKKVRQKEIISVSTYFFWMKAIVCLLFEFFMTLWLNHFKFKFCFYCVSFLKKIHLGCGGNFHLICLKNFVSNGLIFAELSFIWIFSEDRQAWDTNVLILNFIFEMLVEIMCHNFKIKLNYRQCSWRIFALKRTLAFWTSWIIEETKRSV